MTCGMIQDMERESRTRAQRIALYEERVIGFLREAVAEGADKIVPFGMTSERWERISSKGKAYCYLSRSFEGTGELCGDPEPLTGGTIKQDHKAFITNLHKNSPQELKDRFPLSSIFVEKPLPFRSEVTLQVVQQVEKGVNDRRQIAQNTKLTLAQVTNRAQHLKTIGIEIPRAPTFSEELAKRVESEEDDKKLQGILDEIPVNTIRVYMRRDDPKILTFLTNVLKSDGLYVRNRELKLVVDVIKDKEIPIRIVETGFKNKIRGREYPQSYTVVFVKRGKRILKALKENPNVFKRLNNNPVKLVFGPEPKQYPSTHKLKGEEYRSIQAIMWDHFGLRFSGGRGRYEALLSNCSVPILGAHKSHYCSIDKENDLVAFLKERLRELRKIES